MLPGSADKAERAELLYRPYDGSQRPGHGLACADAADIEAEPLRAGLERRLDGVEGDAYCRGLYTMVGIPFPFPAHYLTALLYTVDILTPLAPPTRRLPVMPNATSVTSNTQDTVFISYSHADKRYLEELLLCLASFSLGLERKVEVWDDSKIGVGDNWREEIERAIASARVAILLVSANFLTSSFIVEHELPPLLAAAKNEGVIILCVVVSHCLYDRSELGSELDSVRFVNNPSEPLNATTKSQRYETWLGVVREVKDALLTIGTVFVSHAHADNELCDHYVEALRARRLDVWYDRTNMQAGHSLSSDIEAELHKRAAFVVIATPASLASQWVRSEIAAFRSLAADDPTRLFVPVRAAPCKMPLLWADILWIDAVSIGFDAAVAELAKALRAPFTLASPIAAADSGPPIASQPVSVDDLIAQAAELGAQRQYEKSLRFCEQALALDPDNQAASALREMNLDVLGRHDEAYRARLQAMAIEAQRKK